MAARKPKDEDLLPDPSQDDLDLYDFIEEIGGQISIVDVFRMQRDGSMPHIDRVTIDVVREDVYSYLRSFGPGKYCLQFKSADRTIKRRRTIEVADKGAPAPGVNGTPPAAPLDHIQILREEQARTHTLLMALITSMGSNKGPDLSFLSGVLKPPDMTPVVTLMSAMINRKPEGGMDGVQLAKTIVELSASIGGDGGKDDNWFSVAKEVGGQFFKALPAQAGTDPNAPPPAALPAPVSPIPPPAPPAARTQPEALEALPMTKENFPRLLAAGIGELKHMARKNRDVEAAIDWVLECAEDTNTWAAVCGAVQQGATFDNLLQFDPEIAQTPQLKDWFLRFYNGLRTEIFQHVDTAGPGGHPDNPGGNAGAGPTGPVATPDPKPGS